MPHRPLTATDIATKTELLEWLPTGHSRIVVEFKAEKSVLRTPIPFEKQSDFEGSTALVRMSIQLRKLSEETEAKVPIRD